MLGKLLPHPGADEDVLAGPLEQFVASQPGHVPGRLEPAKIALSAAALWAVKPSQYFTNQ
jgi:hypothetical protein